MRALLLDPTAGTVTEVDYDGDYRSIYKLIDCETFTTVGLDDKGNTLFVDDEGAVSVDGQRRVGKQATYIQQVPVFEEKRT